MVAIRPLAYFDLLGFKAIVQNHSLDAVVELLARVFDAVFCAAVRHAVRVGGPTPAQVDVFRSLEPRSVLSPILQSFQTTTGYSALLMSDSLIVFKTAPLSTNESLAAPVTTLVLTSRIIMMKLFELLLPARGALCCGEFHVDVQNGLYCGKALVEATELAESQEWIGAVIGDSLSNEISRLTKAFDPTEWAERFQATGDFTAVRPKWNVVRYEVPFKSGPRRCWVVNWASAWNAGGPVRDDFFDQRLVGNPFIDDKYHNTLEFLKNWNASSDL
jgi:class 3 adenylate cyclase